MPCISGVITPGAGRPKQRARPAALFVRPPPPPRPPPQQIGEDSKLRLSLWDYGGQRIFQVFQHLLIVRRALYLVVFNMSSFLESPAKSFDFLDFWIYSIVMHAEGAPIFIIGTRGDEVTDTESYVKISELLKERYKGVLGSSLVFNDFEKLFFFPVDNTSSKPEDLAKFKRITTLTEAKISSDKVPPLLPTEENPAPLPYIDDMIPISWLIFYHELRKISAEKEEEDYEDGDEDDPHPFLPTGLASKTPDQDSDLTAFSIARDCKVFEGLTTIEDQKSRLEVVLKALNELGLVIFFHHSESLKSYVILQPQCLMDQICFVIRDFKRHRLRRDARIQRKVSPNTPPLPFLPSSFPPHLHLHKNTTAAPRPVVGPHSEGDCLNDCPP